MIRVLHFLNGLGMGGAETFVMNVYRSIDRTKVQFDFMIRSDDLGPYADEIEAMGGKIFHSPFFPSRAIDNYRYLSRFFKEHAGEYAAVHVHANALIYILPLFPAKKQKIPVRIMHSHSSSSDGRLAGVVHKINKPLIRRAVTHRFACSDSAGKWMFGNDEYEFISNGIDLEKYRYDTDKRQSIRNELDISDKTVIGHVGRFTKAKNHEFLLKCFGQIHINNPDTVLLLIGDGEDMGRIQQLARDMGLENSVIFTGAVGNVSDYLSAMDLFVFPSLWEGLPLTLIEAQSNGIPCLISDKISKMVVLNKNVVSLPIDSEQAWVASTSAYHERTDERSPDLRKYDIMTVSRELEKFYLEAANSSK